MGKKIEYELGNNKAILVNEDGSYTRRDYNGSKWPLQLLDEKIDPATNRKSLYFQNGWTLSIDPKKPTVGVTAIDPNGSTVSVRAQEVEKSASDKKIVPEWTVNRYWLKQTGESLFSTYHAKTDKTTYEIGGTMGDSRPLTIKSQEILNGNKKIHFTNGSKLEFSEGFQPIFHYPNGTQVPLNGPTISTSHKYIVVGMESIPTVAAFKGNADDILMVDDAGIASKDIELQKLSQPHQTSFNALTDKMNAAVMGQSIAKEQARNIGADAKVADNMKFDFVT